MKLADLPPVAFKVGDREFMLDRKGVLTCKRTGAKPIKFRLQVAKGYCVEAIQAFDDSKRLFVLASISNWDSGGAIIQAFDLNTGKSAWSRNFRAFNIGQSVVFDSSWIITGIGAIAKVDLNTGRYVWIHTNLYGQGTGAFNSFETPRMNSGQITFTEEVSPMSSRASQPFKLVVDSSTGRILENTNH